jgi:hypothetical protein
MESPSGFGQAGIRIRDCFLTARELGLGWALELAISAGLVGDGTTGDLTGITTMLFITTTLTYPTAGSSPITTPSIAGARTSIMVADFMVEADFRAEALAEIRGSMDQLRSMDSQPRNMDSRRLMPSPAVIPARSAALIMEELPGDSPLAGSRVSAAGSTAEGVEAFTVAEVMQAVATGNAVHS